MSAQQDFDVIAGHTLKLARHSAGLSQDDLAQALAAFGFPMHQQTILKIEKGSRPIKLAEAFAIAEVFREVNRDTC